MQSGEYTYQIIDNNGCISISDIFIHYLVSNEENTLDFNIYPNPASTFVQVESNNLQVESCSVLDVYGRTIQEFKIQIDRY